MLSPSIDHEAIYTFTYALRGSLKYYVQDRLDNIGHGPRSRGS